MKLKTILCSMLLSLVGLTAFADDTDISTLENAVYIESGATVTIDDNGDAIIPIKMKNAVGVTGYQFNVVLPNGISKDNVTFKKSTARKTDEVSYSGAYQTDGSYKAVAYTSDDNEFSGNDGEIVTMTIANATVGTYSFTIASGSVTSHGTSYKVGADVTSTVTIKENSYDEGFSVTVAPFSVTVGQEYDEDITNTTDNKVIVFKMQNASEVSKVEFDVDFPSGISMGQVVVKKKYYDDPYFAGSYESDDDFPETDDNEDGSKHFTAENTFTAANIAAPIIKIAVTTDEGIASGVYSLNIKNISITASDGTVYSNVAPYSADIYVGSTTPTATVTDGKVTFSGDYSDEDMAAKMLEALPTTDATVNTVDLTGVTALPEGETIITANPNAIITTSTDLGLTNTTNVVIGKTCDNLVLTDGKSFATEKKFTATTASYSRTFVDGQNWATICLPFAVNSDANVAYYGISALNNGVLSIEKYTTLPAGTPALVKKLTSGSAIAPQSASVAVSGALKEVSGDVTMKGTYEKTKITDANAYYIYNNKFYQCNEYFNSGAFRAYFTVNESGAKYNTLTIEDEDIITAVDALTGNSDVKIEAIYDVNGAQRSDLLNGMNIVKLSNGKVQKIMVK